MATARRLYLYVVSGAGLAAWAIAAIWLLRLFFRWLGIGAGGCRGCDSGFMGAGDREGLALALAAGLVGLVLWLIHWGGLEMSVQAPEDAAAAERRSILRSVYFLLVLAITVFAGVSLLAQLLARLVVDFFELQPPSFSFPSDDWMLAAIVVLLSIWAYHAAVRARDVRRGPVIEGAAAWVSRLYLYGVAFQALLSWIAAIGTILVVIITEWARPAREAPASSSGLEPVVSSAPAWVAPVAQALVVIVVWFAVWLGHWLWAARLRSGQTEQSAAERTSRVRLAYFAAVVAYAVAMIILYAYVSFGQFLVWLFSIKPVYPGTTSYGFSYPAWYFILLPALSALPWLAVWLWQRRVAVSESLEASGLGVSAARVLGYIEAFLGMATLALGIQALLGTLFSNWFGAPAPGYAPFDGTGMDTYRDYSFKSSVALAFAAGVVGLAVWIWPWISATRRRAAGAAERTLEVTSSSRAFYLNLLMLGAILTGAAAAGVILYHFLRIILDLDERDLGGALSAPFALLITSVLLYGFHAWVQWRDRIAPPDRPSSETEPAPGPEPESSAGSEPQAPQGAPE